jgi:hypothetical protein
MRVRQKANENKIKGDIIWRIIFDLMIKVFPQNPTNSYSINIGV